MNNRFNNEFPRSVLEQAVAATRIKASSLAGDRQDYRGKTVLAFSESANSLAECAYSLQSVRSGWLLGIHVADVSEYVCENSPLDTEARKRKASVYNSGDFDRSMLPEALAKFCSLSEPGDKLAISTMFEIDENGKIINSSCEKSIIRPACNCIYSEIDQLQSTSDTSAVMLLREKYAPFKNIISNLYELAAQFCIQRAKRGGLDCTYFRRVYETDQTGKIISFRRESEPDSRAMIREIGYFVAKAVGKFMQSKKFPCVYNGRGAVAQPTLDYLSNLVNADKTIKDPAKLTANIAELAKGTPYYGFVCDSLAENVPQATFSVEPSPNSFCGSDTIVSFFTPISRYTDLLIQRTVKSLIEAKDISNLNLNRTKKILAEVVNEVNETERFINQTRKEYLALKAAEYIKSTLQKPHKGFPVHTNEDGSILVVMDSGVFATIPADVAKNYTYAPAQPDVFKVDFNGDEIIVTPNI